MYKYNFQAALGTCGMHDDPVILVLFHATSHFIGIIEMIDGGLISGLILGSASR
jgi:hypothetical protein